MRREMTLDWAIYFLNVLRSQRDALLDIYEAARRGDTQEGFDDLMVDIQVTDYELGNKFAPTCSLSSEPEAPTPRLTVVDGGKRVGS